VNAVGSWGISPMTFTRSTGTSGSDCCAGSLPPQAVATTSSAVAATIRSKMFIDVT
jgi:hypothetical protein